MIDIFGIESVRLFNRIRAALNSKYSSISAFNRFGLQREGIVSGGVLQWNYELNQPVFCRSADIKCLTYRTIQATNLPQFVNVGDEHSHQSSSSVYYKRQLRQRILTDIISLWTEIYFYCLDSILLLGPRS